MSRDALDQIYKLPVDPTKVLLFEKLLNNGIVGGPRATARHRKYSCICWKNFTSYHSFKVSIYYVIKQRCCLSHLDTLCMCALDARFLHSFLQDGSSPTFIQVYQWCLPSLFCGEQLVVHYYKLSFNSVLELISV